MHENILIITGILVAILGAVVILYPIITHLASKACYRVRKYDRVTKDGELKYLYMVEQKHTIFSLIWWQREKHSSRFPPTFYTVEEVECYIKHLLYVEKETVSNVICKNSPNTKVTFD